MPEPALGQEQRAVAQERRHERADEGLDPDPDEAGGAERPDPPLEDDDQGDGLDPRRDAMASAMPSRPRGPTSTIASVVLMTTAPTAARTGVSVSWRA